MKEQADKLKNKNRCGAERGLMDIYFLLWTSSSAGNL
jgi:hypothetical protein